MSAELEKAKSSLEKAEKLQEIMKKANAIIRSGKDVTNKLVEIGLSEDNALKIQKPDFANRIGFAQYQLTNNNATIKRLKDRVNQLESKEKAATAGEEKYKFDGGVVEVNYLDDRVQIFYDNIPSADERQKLKGSGWKWSPKNSAWQRKITPQAISSAKYLTGATGAAPVQEQTGPIDTDELLKKRKFSYVTINLYGALPPEYTGNKTFELVYFDVITANIVEAIRAYFKENLPEIESEKVKVSVYAKTYIKESQRLVDQNRYLPNDAPAKIVLGPLFQQIKDFMSTQAGLEKGIAVEQEHKETLEKVYNNDLTVEEAIEATATDHLNEDPEYYDKLEQIESPKSERPFLELEPNHPLNILDKNSPQYKEALSEYENKVNLEEIGDPSLYSDEQLAKFKDMLSIKSVANIFPNYKKILAAITAEQKKRNEKNESIIDSKEKYIAWKQAIYDSKHNAVIRQHADRLPEQGNGVDYQKIVDATEKLLNSGREKDKKVAAEWAQQMVLSAQWLDPQFKDLQRIAKFNNPEARNMLEEYRFFGIDVPANVVEIVRHKPKEDFVKEHIIFAKVPDHHAKVDANDDQKIQDRYPKLSKSEIVKIYNEVEAILGKEDYSPEDKYILEKYEGLGSQTATGIVDKGLLHQFYTPYIIAKKMWELGFIYGVPRENPIVIEPSMGTGRFFKFAPQGATCIGFDPDKKNVEIAKILYPNITIYQQEFETAFLEAPRYNRMAKKSWLPEADLCIGNPPYGDYMGYYKSYMPSAFKRFEFLFIYLGLKTLKPGGLLIFIVSQNFMNNGAMYNGMKAKILELGEFVDAIRLPNGIFSSTDVGTDIVIFRKK